MELLLNTDKIIKELEAQKRSKAWLAGEIGVQRQALYYALDNRLITWAGKIGAVLKIDPVKLIEKEDINGKTNCV